MDQSCSHCQQTSGRHLDFCPNSAVLQRNSATISRLSAALAQAQKERDEARREATAEFLNALDYVRMVINSADSDRLWKEGNIAAKDLVAAIDRFKPPLLSDGAQR